MDHRNHDLNKINEINNDYTKITSYTISNIEEPTPLDNTTTAQSYVSYYSRVIHRRKTRRIIRKTDALYLIRRLPMQITNNTFVNEFFNGSRF
ncbi:unnamed protein product [Rhizophagus irregularis]|uniref:Uncharacterized protein n=1 Tax=Rhizophagus irregularis TaxID=588596 RepID=A0A916DZN1_9GLOM|nr:hypothetical protein OCT59_009348 [Rhizophagus irregularis]CAB4418884.1 unnamed protein product [Rhizophagus irregularis]CAB4480504.1 unnamed protein product [Rhizophagus irregularis]CAB5148394.1 unnamed protein product [Rhizophagus irregularis]CAB5331596.1 unnamed protein product [Rhizophagus irregularis]